jgi:phosphatidylcholine synthase
MKTKPMAFSVHLLTASGAALALMALIAATQGNWVLMFAWLGVALIVDGVDGPLARKMQVKTHASNWDGVILDLVIDYLTYVFIPAYALIYMDLMPSPWGLISGLLIALTGVVYFADVRMKAEDKSFIGFPAAWQMLVLVFLTLRPPVWMALGIIVVLALAQFTPLKFIHPVRTRRWRRLNLPLSLVWMFLAAWSVVAWFDPPAAVKVVFGAVSAWLTFAGIVMQVFPARRREQAEPDTPHPVSAE